ncbi:MAG: hypothetical protein K2X53_00910 [Alphaproteobacteria bacterium]|nr:hypothetical protein [Alphaproteobacteria bacterium]
MKIGISNWIISKIGGWLMKDRAPEHDYLCDFDRICYETRPCDVLLIEGRNHISNIIKNITQSPWSHAALYIGRIHDIDDPKLRQHIRQYYHGPSETQLLIESILGKGTIVVPINTYINDHIRICRPEGLSRSDAQKVISFAVGRLGVKYSVRHIFDLFRFLFPWTIMPRKWRSTVFETNPLKPTHDICSSMLAAAFASVKFPILPIVKHSDEKGVQLVQRNPKLFTPSDFDYSPYFSIIKYPFFTLAENLPYKNLPWSEEVDKYSGNISEVDKLNDDEKAS